MDNLNRGLFVNMKAAWILCVDKTCREYQTLT